MTEEEDNKDADGKDETPKGPTIKVDVDVYRWLKNAAAGVAIISTLAGILFTAVEARRKAVAEREAEADKLTLGREQIQLDIEKKKLDIKQLEDTASAAERKEERDRLTALISKMYEGEGSGEGNIAGLFEFVQGEEANREIAENAVLARLENPRSLEEIDLGLNFLEEIGPSALCTIIRANVEARARLFSVLFNQADRLQLSLQNAHQRLLYGYPLANRTELSVVFYAAMTHTISVVKTKSTRAKVTDPAEEQRAIEMSARVISKSNRSFERVLQRVPVPTLEPIDFSYSYITLDLILSPEFSKFEKHLRCYECFVEIVGDSKDGIADRLLKDGLYDALIISHDQGEDNGIDSLGDISIKQDEKREQDKKRKN